MATKTKFTAQHIANFKAYRKVQRSARYNMMAECRRAAQAAGLFIDDYLFVIENYEALAKLAGEE